MVLIKFLFYAVVIYFALKAVGRLFLPFLSNKVAQKINNHQGYKQRKEGDITIHYQDNKNSKFDKNIGEYVDYEEIKE
jgi:hypothetical protein